MDIIGHLYKTKTLIRISNNLQIVCEEGMRLKITKDCSDESYLHELTHYWREGLKEKKLKKDDIVEVLGCWRNFYGTYIKCTTFSDESFDVKPENLSLI